MEYEAAMESTVSRAAARREVERHGCEFSEFVEDCGDKPTYAGKTVLDWLGY